ncbi:MAG: ABC transporter permease, partial [Microthrixaceae bacterium]
MTTAALPADATPRTPSAHTVPTGPLWLLRDTWTEANRHLIATWRNPDLLVFAAIQPIMFVVLFV